MIEYLLEVSVCLLLFYVFYRLFLAGSTFFLINRLFLIFSLISSFLIPVLHFSYVISPTESESLILPDLQVMIQESSHLIEESTFQSNFWQISSSYLILIYLTILTVLIIRQFYLLFRLFHFIYKNPKSAYQGYTLVQTGGKLPTASFFRFILWDNTQQLHTEEERYILNHELAHIQNLHSFDLFLFEIAKTILWFNPLIYKYKRDLCNLHEYEADAQASKEQDKSYYKKLIIKAVFPGISPQFIHPFSQSQIILRLKKLSQKKTHFMHQFKLFFLLPVVLMLLFAFSFDLSIQEVVNEVKKAVNKIQSPIQNAVIPILTSKNNQEKEAKSIEAKENKVLKKEENKRKLEDERKRELPKVEMIVSKSNTLDTDIEPNKVYLFAQEFPKPHGGLQSFYTYIAKNLKYPKTARKANINGKVFVEFTVNKEGRLTQAHVVKGIHPDCDKEAIDVISNSPAWVPGKNNGKIVEVKMTVPIVFKMDDSEDRRKLKDSDKTPLYIVDGKETKDSKTLQKVNPENIVAIDVIKDQKALEGYGEKGKNGVIILKSKKLFGKKRQDGEVN